MILAGPPDQWKRLGTSPTKQACVLITMTMLEMMAPTERESPTAPTAEGIRAPAQRGDTKVDGEAGVEMGDGTSGVASVTSSIPMITIATADEPLERSRNWKRQSSESPEVSKAPGD
jgi:hypothetical protein